MNGEIQPHSWSSSVIIREIRGRTIFLFPWTFCLSSLPEQGCLTECAFGDTALGSRQGSQPVAGRLARHERHPPDTCGRSSHAGGVPAGRGHRRRRPHRETVCTGSPGRRGRRERLLRSEPGTGGPENPRCRSRGNRADGNKLARQHHAGRRRPQRRAIHRPRNGHRRRQPRRRGLLGCLLTSVCAHQQPHQGGAESYCPAIRVFPAPNEPLASAGLLESLGS